MEDAYSILVVSAVSDETHSVGLLEQLGTVAIAHSVDSLELLGVAIAKINLERGILLLIHGSHGTL